MTADVRVQITLLLAYPASMTTPAVHAAFAHLQDVLGEFEGVRVLTATVEDYEQWAAPDA